MSELARSHSVQGTRWDWYSVASVLTFVAEAVKDSVANLQLSDPLPVLDRIREKAHIKSLEEYRRMHAESLADPTKFWGQAATHFLTWFRRFDVVQEGSFAYGDVAWFRGGMLNVSFNCIDRHLDKRAEQVAIIWEGDTVGQTRSITYRELYQEVCRLGNVLKSLGVRKGDRVAICISRSNVVFAGFSAESLRDRINNAGAKILITADEGVRGGRTIYLKRTVDDALTGCPTIEKVLVYKRTGAAVPMTHGRDIVLNDIMATQRPYLYCVCPPEWMESEDPLFLLYTSGSTGAPKGLMHTTAGYLLFTAITHKYVFDYHDGEIYACVADIGWITGHSYIVYGPLCNGATTVMFESLPTYPDAGRYWDLVARHKINIFYTAPTAIRTLMALGDQHVKKHDRSSLRILGSVGEPINPEAWKWYFEVVGEKRCAIVDTYWQTETGGHVITPLPGAIPPKPGAATLPFFGIDAVVVDGSNGKELTENNVSGVLCIRKPWPAIARTVDLSSLLLLPIVYPPFYFTGDGCHRDQDGYIWVTGRVDDVINKSGHRLGTAEIESALVAHPGCAEAAVIGVDDKLKGQAVWAYCILRQGFEESNDLIGELKMEVRKHIGGIATPDVIVITRSLPKTRSGKIMRRILRKISHGEFKDIGDTSTLNDPEGLEILIKKVATMLSASPAH